MEDSEFIDKYSCGMLNPEQVAMAENPDRRKFRDKLQIGNLFIER